MAESAAILNPDKEGSFALFRRTMPDGADANG